MRLIQLRVEHFGCVRSADIEFGPRLNVLHGPNDLGKSSLVAAMRAALLLPHSSSAHERYVPWNDASRPQVELTLQTEPHRYYRIRKTFGSKGSSFLEFSRDGLVFQSEAKGRQVDGVIRGELLRWGIPQPGGRGGARGMPISFLTTTLLGQQDSVTEIFGSKLGDDLDDSGKELLTTALQATTRDPFFAAILDGAQAEVSKAFTPTGKRSKARKSPFNRVATLIKQASAELDDLLQKAQGSGRVREQLAQLKQALLAKHADHKDAEDTQRNLERIDVKQRELDEAQTELDEINRLVADAQAAEQSHDAAFERCDALQRQRDERADSVQEARDELEAANQHLQDIERDQSDTVRRVQECELARANVETELRGARDRAAGADRVRHAEALCRELADDIGELDAAVSATRDNRARDRAQLETLDTERELLTGVEHWLRWRQLEQRLEQGQQAAVELATLFTQAEEAEQTAGELTAGILTRALPNADTMDRLHKLDEELRLAEAALEVGISVIIESPVGVRIEASRDREVAEDLGDVRGVIRLSATREICLSLPELADIRIMGGSEQALERYRRTRERWTELAEPVFERTGATSLAELDLLVTEDLRNVDRVVELRDQQNLTMERAESQRQRLVDDEPLRRDAAEWKNKLANYDLDAVSRRAEALREREGLPRDLGARLTLEREALDRDHDAMSARLEQAALEQAKDEARRDGLRQQLAEARTQRDAAVAELPEPWQRVQEQAEQTIATLEDQLSELDDRRARLSSQAGSALESARARVATARQRLEQSEQAHTHISRTLEQARTEQTRLNYEFEVKTQAAENVNPQRAGQRVSELTSELRALRGELGIDADGRGVTVEDIAGARGAAERLRGELRVLENQLHEVQGALRETGGDRIREQTQAVRAHLDHLQKQQRDLELDYDAWKLLRDTLRDVEKAQAAHLGRIMIAPITEQFRELTMNRYGAMELGPNLETHGIHAAGERRDVTILSMGTKEQLSALFRLSLAEKLGSAVLLDDQLTQTDPQRMAWFRTKLREISRAVQVIRWGSVWVN